MLKVYISEPVVVHILFHSKASPHAARTAHTMKQVNTIKTASSKGEEKQPSIRFLNLTNPNDATKSDALTVIRSHVARTTHGRKQESRRVRLEIRQYRPATQSNRTNNRWSQEDIDSQAVQDTEEPNLPAARQRKNHEEARPIEPKIWIPNPQTFLTRNRRNPFQSSAKRISDYENVLVDHCKNPWQSLFILLYIHLSQN